MNNCHDCLFKGNPRACRQCSTHERHASGCIIKSYMIQETPADSKTVASPPCAVDREARKIAELEYRLWQSEEEVRRLKGIIGGI